MDKKYNEFEVISFEVVIKNDKQLFVFDDNGNPKIKEKRPTKREHVMISDRDAEINNQQTRFNKLHYELAESGISEERKALEDEAKELGVKFNARIGDAKLQEKINEAKTD